LQSGLWGPHKDFHLAYVSMIPHVSSKKGTPPLAKVFPEFYDWATLGAKEKEEELGIKAAKAMAAMGGMPAHIRQKLLGK
jgi:hypothetical protein